MDQLVRFDFDRKSDIMRFCNAAQFFRPVYQLFEQFLLMRFPEAVRCIVETMQTSVPYFGAQQISFFSASKLESKRT